VVLTALFLVVITCVTSEKAAAGFAPIAIGLTLVTIPFARARSALQDDVEDQGSHRPANHLGDDVGDRLAGLEASGRNQPARHGRIEVGASVNPARSTATAIFAGGEALRCLWL
jgi:hypothetical protein